MRFFSLSMSWYVLAFVSSLILIGCVEPQADTENTYQSVPYVPTKAPSGIQAGEKLDVFVMEDDSFSGNYTVRSTGHVIIPKLGRVKVGGLSTSGAESAIATALEEDKLTKASVLVDRPDIESSERPKGLGTEVFLSGKVVRPGRYTITGIGNAPATVHQAVLQAGGCSRFAYKSQVHILRRGSNGVLRRINSDLEAIESGKSPDVPLAQGDIVVVPEKMIDFGL